MRSRIEPSPSRGCRAFGFRARAGIAGRLGADTLEAVLMRIAIDAMGGDHGPGSIIDGALVAARHLQIGLLLVGARGVVDAELRRHPGAAALDIETLDAPEWVEMAEPAAAALRRKPRASIRVAAEAVRNRPCGRALQRRTHRRLGDRGARGIRAAAGRGSARAGDNRSDPRPAGGPARLRRDGRMPTRSIWCSSRCLGRRMRGSRSGVNRRAWGCCRWARKRAKATR